MSRTGGKQPGAEAPFSWPGILGSVAVVGLVAVHGLSATLGSALAPHRLAVIDSLSGPEAVSYDAAHEVYLVSNVNGSVGVKDGNGFISRIRSDGRMDSLHFIQGGRNGVVLNGPMGSRIRGDTLWVLDIDALRAFDTRSGAPITSVDLTPVHPLLPNDLTFAPDGDIYITDTGRRVNPDGTAQDTRSYRIYRVTPDRRVTVALESPALDAPDGIAWNAAGRDLVLAPIGGQAMQTWRAGAPAPVNLAPGPGKFDGLEVEADGRILLTSWNDSSVSELRGNQLVRRIGPLGAPPADVSLDRRHGRVGVVFLTANRFELWTLPPNTKGSADAISRN
jgi:sugar lactone lactonase YvrE